VLRYNRKMILRGEKVDAEKTTWPLPWEGECSIISLMTSCGWNENEIASLRTQLFDCKDECGVHPNCSMEQVCWPDLQQVFRSVLSDGPWSEELNMEYPPLDGRKATLRLKVPSEEIVATLEGEYRMYCKPDEGQPFSYGLVIDNVTKSEEQPEDDTEVGTFSGRSRVRGKYVVEEGTYRYIKKSGNLNISYIENWTGGSRDALTARVKSNAKFQCESAGGFEQKASNETRNLPADAEDRIGEFAPHGVKKYYLFDGDAAMD